MLKYSEPQLMFKTVKVQYLQFFLLTLDQSTGQVCVGAGQVAQSALQVAHFGNETFISVTKLTLRVVEATKGGLSFIVLNLRITEEEFTHIFFCQSLEFLLNFINSCLLCVSLHLYSLY